eukprot:COSAG02_NODE_12954_length_1467_cov_40.726608_1_plen_62_part_00
MGWADAVSSLPCVLLLTLGVGAFQLKVYLQNRNSLFAALPPSRWLTRGRGSLTVAWLWLGR